MARVQPAISGRAGKMKIRRPSRTVKILWALFVAPIFIGLVFFVASGVPGGPLLMLVGAVGNLAMGIYIFVTVPRTER